MSRNKDIKALHVATGKSYKECRAAMKAANWSYFDAWYIINGGNVLLTVAELAESVGKAIINTWQSIANNLKLALQSITPEDIAKAIKAAQEAEEGES